MGAAVSDVFLFDDAFAQALFGRIVRDCGFTMFEIDRWARVCRTALIWWRMRLRAATRDDIAQLLLNMPADAPTAAIARFAPLRPSRAYEIPAAGGILLWCKDEYGGRLDELVGYSAASFVLTVKPLIGLTPDKLERHCMGYNAGRFAAFARWDDVLRWALRPREPPVLFIAPDEPLTKKRRLV